MRILLVLTLTGLVGCDHAVTPNKLDSTGVPDGCIALIGVTPPSTALFVGDSIRPSTIGDPCFPPRSGFGWVWRSSDSTVATVDSLSAMVRARAVGIATIFAVWVSDPTEKGAMAVIVKAR